MLEELKIILDGQHQHDEHVAMLDSQKLITGDWCPEHKMGVVVVGTADQLGISEVSCVLAALRALEEHLMAQVAKSLAREVWRGHERDASGQASKN